MGEIGEKGALRVSVSWEEHFQALRSTVAGTLKGKKGHPVAVHLLGVVRDIAELFPLLMEEEDHRDFYLRQIGTPWLITRRPCPWDWDTMRPVLMETVNPQLTLEEDESMIVEGWGPRPTNAEETLAFMALSKGLAWMVGRDEEEKTPVLLHGLRGLTDFPFEPKDLPAELPFTMAEMALADDLAKGLNVEYTSVFMQAMREEGRPVKDLMEATTLFWPGLPRAVTVGGAAPVFTPTPGAPFEDELAQLLGVGAGAWADLRLHGETKGHPWELNFSVTCRGLEVDEEDREARWVFDITPLWAGGLDAKRLAHTWEPEEWENWRKAVAGTVSQAQERLRGTTNIQARAVAKTRAEASLTTPPASLEPLRRVTSWTSYEARTSHLAQSQLKHLLTGNTGRIKSLPAEEAQLIQEGLRMETRPEWLKPSRGKGKGWELDRVTADRLRTGLLQERHGFFEADQSGALRWVKGLTLENGETCELRIGGQGLRFMNRSDLRKAQESIRKREADLAKEIKGLRDTMGKTLFKADVEDELGSKQERLGELQEMQESLTSWRMAMDLLKHLVDEVAAQPRNPIEVDALTFRDWMWPGREAPDNWLQTVVETLSLLFNCSAAVVSGGKELAGGSFIHVSTMRRDDPGHVLTPEEARGLKGGNLVYVIRINEALLGATVTRKTGTMILRSGVVADVFEAGKLTRAQEKARNEAGDRDLIREAHLAVMLRALGYDEVETTLAEHLNAHMTKAGVAVSGKWTIKPKGGRYEDGDLFRRYTSAFHDCPFLPAPGGPYFHAALGSWKKAPEQGWEMGGKPTPSMHKGGLLHHMGLDLPSGPASGAKRKAVLLRGLHALRRVVVELGEGVLAARMPDGTWHDLAEAEDEVALFLMESARVFPFFKPGWVARAKAAYQDKEGLILPQGIRETDENRWKTRPATPETTMDGIPLHVHLGAEIRKRKITQGQAAKELGVSQKTVSLWVSGKGPLSADGAAKVRGWITQGS